MKTIASEIASDPELRTSVIQAVLKDVATKEDLEKLEDKPERKIEELRRDLNSLMKWMIGLMASMWISIVVGIIVALMKLG